MKLEPSTLHLPRILCLHGGGTNSRIFRSQCRALSNHLKTEYRLVFAEAPFDSNPGSDVLAVYSEWDPFRRWLRWRREHPPINPEDAVTAIDQSLCLAMHQDDLTGATGEWVAILGFSQGAKVAASVLYRQQVWQDRAPSAAGPLGVRFRFGILLAGQAPLVSLDPDPDVAQLSGLADAAQITDVSLGGGTAWRRRGKLSVLRVPTLHIHGLRDPGLERHRVLLEDFCDLATSRVVEWDGDHRVPLKIKDVLPVVQQIRELTRVTEKT